MASEQFSLCWDNFHKNMSSGMNSLLESEDLVDVTLAVQGKCLKAHKMVLSVCSPYFKELFKSNPCQHPIVFMKDVSYEALSDLLQFMYQGEVQVSQENLSTFIKTAEALQIKGLTGDGNGSTDNDITEVPLEKQTPHIEEYKPVSVPRPKKQQLSSAPIPAPSVKRQRLSSNESQSVSQSITKVEPVIPPQTVSVPAQEPSSVHFKMEPYDQTQNLLDETGDDNFGDDTLDENVGDDTEDYSMMETGTGSTEEEPQAGTSTDGAGEGQGLSRKARIYRIRIYKFQNWTEIEFLKKFRISKRSAMEVFNQIDIGSRTKRSKGVSPEDMLLITLTYFATGSMLIAATVSSGIHISTVSDIVCRVSRAIVQLGKVYIKMPETKQERSEVRVNLYKVANFPRCIGALDCTHIKIQSPGGDTSEVFRNQKGYFSIKVQCICDASLTLRNIVCRWPGSTPNSTIWNNSIIRAKFENGEMEEDVLVGDGDYSMKQYLVTPVLNPRTPEEHLFNESQIRTRYQIQRFFRIWKRRFPILVQGIRLQVQDVQAVVMATAVLQNIALGNADPLPPPLDENLENLIEQMNNIDAMPVPEVTNPINFNNATRQKFLYHFSTFR